jgi:hypothetical protein
MTDFRRLSSASDRLLLAESGLSPLMVCITSDRSRGALLNFNQFDRAMPAPRQHGLDLVPAPAQVAGEESAHKPQIQGEGAA